MQGVSVYRAKGRYRCEAYAHHSLELRFARFTAYADWGAAGRGGIAEAAWPDGSGRPTPGPEASRRACRLPQVIGCGWGGIDGPREILRQFGQAREITQQMRPGLRPHIRIIPLTLMDRREGEAFRARREKAFDAGFGIAAGVTTVPAESGKPDCGQAVRCVTNEVGAIQPQALVAKARGETTSPPQRDQQMAFPKTQGAAGIQNRRGRDRYLLAREIHAMLNLVAHKGKAALGGRDGIVAGELLGDPANPRVVPVDHGIHSQKGVMRLMIVHGVSYRR